MNGFDSMNNFNERGFIFLVLSALGEKLWRVHVQSFVRSHRSFQLPAVAVATFCHS
jgi:hypothetical protein